MGRIAVFIIFILVSCESKWENKKINEFLSKNVIDTTEYNTCEELFLNGKINKIVTSNCQENVFIQNPIVSENKFIYIEKKHNSDNNKIVFLKIDKNGKTIDSLIIDRDVAIINDYIINKNSYYSWFVDNDKNIKKLENVNFFSKSDTTKIKSLVKNFKKYNLKFYSTSGYPNNDRSIDTCNYIISFKKDKLVKYNFSNTIHPENDLKIESTISLDFSAKFKEVESISKEDLFKVDNFYAYSLDMLIRQGISGGNLFSNTGTSSSTCNIYTGTYFITILGQSNMKLKLMNVEICENEDIYEYAKQALFYDVSTEAFLNFYLIHSDLYHFYIVKK